MPGFKNWRLQKITQMDPRAIGLRIEGNLKGVQLGRCNYSGQHVKLLLQLQEAGTTQPDTLNPDGLQGVCVRPTVPRKALASTYFPMLWSHIPNLEYQKPAKWTSEDIGSDSGIYAYWMKKCKCIYACIHEDLNE